MICYGIMKIEALVVNKKMIISFIINILISIMTVNAITMSIMGFKFMYGYEPYPELIWVPIFSYYTVQSNIFRGIISFIFANREYQILRGSKKNSNNILYF